MKYLQYLSLALLVGCSPAIKNAGNPDITQEEIKHHIQYLASPELKGRRSGEEGNTLAAKYIAQQFASYGLTPLGKNNDYFQPFTFVSVIKMGKTNSLVISEKSGRKEYLLDKQFRPISFTENTTVTAPLVFVGYGITAKTDSLKYDDYTDVDVKQKIVVAMRFSPEGGGNNRYTRFQALMEKALTAKDHGASGIIFLTAPQGEEGSNLISFTSQATQSVGIAVATMLWEEMDSIVQSSAKKLGDIRQTINTMQKPQSFELDHCEATLQTQTVKVYATTSNIIGKLDGSDPLFKGQCVVLGAHMDHLGMGGQGSLLPDTVAIHPGADDNASGTAGLLELAQYFSAHRQELKRTVVFISFSGEEEGLLGSDYYVNNPLFPVDSTIAMINMDMIGRLRDSTLVVEGMGTSPQWEKIVREENRDSLFHLKLKPDGFGPSDHSSFYAKNIPVMFFFTNLHGDYHRPTDTWEKINFSGEQTVVRYVSRVSLDLINLPARPQFTKATTTASSGDERGEIRVSLGVVPDFAEDTPGLRITGTRPNSAAEKAGLKGGDIIVKFGPDDVKNIYDFTHDLGKYKPGDKVSIVVKRNGQEVTLTATLEARK
jgi:aminopeptidase YwaD